MQNEQGPLSLSLFLNIEYYIYIHMYIHTHEIRHEDVGDRSAPLSCVRVFVPEYDLCLEATCLPKVGLKS